MEKKFSSIAVFLFFLSSVFVLPVFAAIEKTAEAPQQPGFFSSVLEAARLSLTKLGGYLPKLGGLLSILVLGALAAIGITLLVEKILEAVHLEKIAKKLKIPEILKNGNIGLSLSELISEIIFFLIIIGTLIAALGYYGLAASPLMNQILCYIPQVIAAVFIFIIGVLSAILISGIIMLVGGNVRIAQSDMLGNIAKYAIIIFAGLIALKELGLGVILTESSKNIILGGFIASAALAFGLAAKDKAGKFLDNIFKK